MTEQEMRDLFREMREEPVPANSLARVRAAVDQRIHEKRWMPLGKMAAALAMAGCIVAGLVLLRPARVPAPVEQPVAPEIAQVLAPAESPVAPERPAVSVARPRRVQQKPAEAVPISIRIETPDPNVVILLVN